MYINNKLVEAEYTKCVIECTKEVNRLNPSTKNNQLDKISVADPENNGGYSNDKCYQIKTDRLNIGCIAPQQELNLFLLRYWNLYDSLFYSKIIMSKLKTWVQDGEKNL